jgi:hypothetical protein
MPLNAQLRKVFLRRYIVYRIKAIEFFDLSAIRQALLANQTTVPTPVGRTNEDFSNGLRTVLLSWMALFIDKSKDGMDVIPMWKELFPTLAKDIDAAWKQMEPTWDTIRTFRDRAGFHADTPLKFFQARSGIITNQAAVTKALEEFEKLQRKILNSEGTTLPDLEAALDALLDELEQAQQRKYKRDEFKRYLIIPNTSGK